VVGPGSFLWGFFLYLADKGQSSYLKKLFSNTFSPDCFLCLLDSSIKNSRGKMYMKKVFLGNYSGPCQQDTKKIPIENYLDLPRQGFENASPEARASVAQDLIFCGVLLTSLSQTSDAEKSKSLSGLGSHFLKKASNLLDDDNERFKQESAVVLSDVQKNIDNIEMRVTKNQRCKAFFEGEFDQAVDQAALKKDKEIGR
jgi:hypothetical protein